MKTEILYFEDKKTFFHKIIRRLPFNLFVNTRPYHNDFNDTDFLYIRKMALDYPVLLFLKKYKKNNPNGKILLEIPTYPYDQEIHKKLFFQYYNIRIDSIEKDFINMLIELLHFQMIMRYLVYQLYKHQMV